MIANQILADEKEQKVTRTNAIWLSLRGGATRQIYDYFFLKHLVLFSPFFIQL